MAMTGKERVRQALAGAVADRPPISFWGHNYAREHAAEALAAETVARHRRYDWDFVKLQSRASCFAEGWGLRLQPSKEPAARHTLLDWPVKSAQDLLALQPLDPAQGALGEQLAALRLVRAKLGPDVPIIATVFAPAMALSYLFGEPSAERGKLLLEYLRAWPQAVHAGLRAATTTLADYAQACIEAGADGIFFATTMAVPARMSRDQYAEFGLPYDRQVLDAAQRGWFNLLHLCGAQVYFDVAADLPTAAINWDVTAGNPGLAEGRRLARRAVVGGVSYDEQLRTMTPEQVAAQVRAALAAAPDGGVLIGPGCSIPPDTPEANLRAARAAVEACGGQRQP